MKRPTTARTTVCVRCRSGLAGPPPVRVVSAWAAATGFARITFAHAVYPISVVWPKMMRMSLNLPRPADAAPHRSLQQGLTPMLSSRTLRVVGVLAGASCACPKGCRRGRPSVARGGRRDKQRPARLGRRISPVTAGDARTSVLVQLARHGGAPVLFPSSRQKVAQRARQARR